MFTSASDQTRARERTLAQTLALSAAHRYLPVISIASPLNAVVVAGYAVHVGDSWSVLVWAALACVVGLLGLVAHRRRVLLSPADPGRAFRSFVARNAVAGLVWGAVIADAVVGPAEPAFQYLLLAVAVGMSASGALAHMRAPPAAFAYVAPLFALTIAAFAFVRPEAAPVVIPLAVAYMVFLYFIIRAGHGSFQEHVAALAALSHQAAALQQARREREAMIATLSHEIRTPLHQIAGFAEILRQNAARAQRTEEAEFAGFVEDAAKQLHQHLNRLFEARRLDLAQEDFTPTVVDVPAILERMRLEMAERLARKKQTLAIATAVAAAAYRTDPEALRFIVANLVENAAKFSPPGAVINVAAVLSDARLTITVMDQGVGMSSAELAQAFEPFYRGEEARMGQEPGLGVGLFIVRLLIERMGGEAKLASAPGAGALAHVRLPALPPPDG